MDPLELLTDADLTALAAAIRSGRLTAPFTPVSVRRYCAPLQATAAGCRFQQLHEEGMRPQHMALLAETIVRTRRRQPQEADLVDLVWNICVEEVRLMVSVHGLRVTCVQRGVEVRAEAGDRASPENKPKTRPSKGDYRA